MGRDGDGDGAVEVTHCIGVSWESCWDYIYCALFYVTRSPLSLPIACSFDFFLLIKNTIVYYWCCFLSGA